MHSCRVAIRSTSASISIGHVQVDAFRDHSVRFGLVAGDSRNATDLGNTLGADRQHGGSACSAMGLAGLGEKPTWIGGSLVMGVGVIDIATKSKRHRNAFKVPAESAFAKLRFCRILCSRFAEAQKVFSQHCIRLQVNRYSRLAIRRPRHGFITWRKGVDRNFEETVSGIRSKLQVYLWEEHQAMWKFRYSTLCAILLAALLHSETPAMSQEFPKKQPVKIVVASNAGGLTNRWHA